MPTKNLSTKLSFLQHTFGRRVACAVVGTASLGVVLLGSSFGPNVLSASAQTACGNNDIAYTIRQGDTLGTIAQQYGMTYQVLASHNQIANPNLIFVNQQICIPTAKSISTPTPPVGSTGGGTQTGGSAPVQPISSSVGTSNPFPYGQCTYWADERYHELHSVYVPWTTNANAYQWSSDAQEYGWHVSSVPTVGSIIQLDAGVQGTGSYGHVGMVEQIQSNGDVVVSNMNWNGNGSTVSNWTFTPGSGVHFITR